VIYKLRELGGPDPLGGGVLSRQKQTNKHFDKMVLIIECVGEISPLSFYFYSCTVQHLDHIKVFHLPTNAQ
jgi:hypothetical protein